MAEGQRSLLAPWLGGASSRPGAASNGGQRSMLAPWMGGASSGGIAPTTNGGVRSLFAFWMGGAASFGVPDQQATPGRIQHDFAAYVCRKRREIEELEEEAQRVIAERATANVRVDAAADKRAFVRAGLAYRDIYAELLAAEREIQRQYLLEEEAIAMMMIALLSR